MAISFADLKKNRNEQLNRLNDAVNKINPPKYEEDTRFWYPNVDKVGNGYAVIRFLPAPEGEDIPFVRQFDHSFQGPTKSWLIEKCPTTIGKECPICEANKELWNSGEETDKKIASRQKRKTSYISNVLIIKDPANPENEGQVRLFRYGKKIWDKLNEKMNPPSSFEDEKPMNPFDLWEGASFKLKIRNVDNFRNYDKSEFGEIEPVFDDDAKIEKLWKSEYKLGEFVAEDKFKEPDAILSRFKRVNGLEGKSSNKTSKPVEVAEKKESKPQQDKQTEGVDDDDDTSLDYYKNLADSE